MSIISQKELYEDAKLSTEHIYQIKWFDQLQIPIVCEEVWNTVHNFLLSNKTRTLIWEQLHLNFYTQYSYNKWHGKTDRCPLCNRLPESIYHVILHCDFVNTIWIHLQPILSQLHNKPIGDQEKALGIIHIRATTGMLLRNWITYTMREQVLHFERMAHHSPRAASLESFKAKLNHSISSRIKHVMIRYNSENKLAFFDKIIAYRGILCEKIQEGKYRLKTII